MFLFLCAFSRFETILEVFSSSPLDDDPDETTHEDAMNNASEKKCKIDELYVSKYVVCMCSV